MISPNLKGSEFEGETKELLIQLRDQHPELVSLNEKPSLQLQNGEIVIPDFQLIVEYSAETRHYIIECQDRAHYSHSILHKIQHIRSKQAFKNFFFVYRDNISPELERVMDEEGVVHRNLADFAEFLRQVSKQLDNQPERPKYYRPPTYAGIDGNELYTVFDHAARRLSDVQSGESRCTCIAIGLYFVKDYENSRGGKTINTIKFLRYLDRARLNPFASYYIGWFDYTDYVRLDDEPEFYDRGYRVERAVFRREFMNFNATGYDLILCDVKNSPNDARLYLSTAIHLKLSNLWRSKLPFEKILLDILEHLGEESSVWKSWVVEGGLLAHRESVVGAVARYLERRGQETRSAYERIETSDQDIMPGDYGGEIEV